MEDPRRFRQCASRLSCHDLRRWIPKPRATLQTRFRAWRRGSHACRDECDIRSTLRRKRFVDNCSEAGKSRNASTAPKDLRVVLNISHNVIVTRAQRVGATLKLVVNTLWELECRGHLLASRSAGETAVSIQIACGRVVPGTAV